MWHPRAQAVRTRFAETELVAATNPTSDASSSRSSWQRSRDRFAFLSWDSLPLIALAILIVGWVPLLWHSEVGIVFRQSLSLLLGVAWRSALAACLICVVFQRTSPTVRRLLIAVLIAWASLPLGTLTVAWKAAWQSADSPWHAVVAIAGGFWNQRSPHDAASAGLGLMRGEAAAIWVHSLAATPWLVGLALGVSRLRIKGLEELAALEGLRWSLPTLQRWGVGLFIALALLATSVLGEMTASDIFAVRTYAEEVYLGYPLTGGFAPIVPGPLNDIEPYQFPWSAHLFANGSFVLALAIGLAWSSRVGQRMQWEPHAARFSTRFDHATGVFALLAIGVLLSVPVFYLLSQAGSEVRIIVNSQGDSMAKADWSLTALLYRMVRVPWRLKQEFGFSLVISLSAVFFATLSAMGLVQLFASRKGWIAAACLLAFCLAIPGPLLGVGAMQLRGVGGEWSVALWDRSLTIPIVLLTIKLIPLATAGLGIIAWQVPTRLKELARLEYRSRWAQQWRVQWAGHLTWHAGVVAALLLLAMTDISATNLVLPPGVDTLSRRLLGMVHAGVDDQVAVITLEQMGGAALLGLWLATILSRPSRDPGMLHSSAERQ